MEAVTQLIMVIMLILNVRFVIMEERNMFCYLVDTPPVTHVPYAFWDLVNPVPSVETPYQVEIEYLFKLVTIK